MFFAKGEIIMNNIYKVIWSKARNCYVVASEIARSHTKSASGSEKIGGVTRRSLLASLMALSLLCGGLGVAEAAVVHVDEVPGGTKAVYTTDETYTMTQADAKYATQAALGDYAKSADVYSKTEADAKYATQTALGDYAKSAEVYSKTEADAKYATQAALGDYAKSADVYSKTEADGKFATQAELNAKADVTALGEYAKTVDVNNALSAKADKTDLDTANGKITDLQKKTAKLSADGTELTGMTTVSGATVSGTNVEAGALKVTGEISNGAGVTTTLTDIKASMDKANANETAIGQLQTTTTNQQTAIDGLNKKTTKITYDASNGTSVDGVTFNAGAVTGVTSINGTEIGTKESGTYIHQDSSIWGNMKKVDTQVKTNADNIETNKNDITKLDAKVGTVSTGTYLDPTKSVGENLGRLDAGLKKEVDDRTAAVEAEKTAREAEDTNLSNRIGTVTEDGTYIKKSATNNVSENLKVLDTRAKTNAEAIAKETADRKAAIGELTVDGNYIKKDKNVSDNLVELDKQAKANADAITETNQRTHGITRDDTRNETRIEGKVTVDTDGNIKAEGTITSNGLNAGSGEITTSGKVSAGDVSTGTLETTGNAKIGGDLDVGGTLKTKDVAAETIHISKSEDTTDYKSEGSIIGEGGKLSVSNEKTDKRTNITEKSELNVNEKGTVNWATSTENATGNVTVGRSEVTADKIKNSVKKTEGGTTFGYEENITADGKVGTVTDKDGNRNELTQTATGTENTVTSKDGNKSTTKQEAGSISSTVYDQDGNVKASSEMKEDGSISNNATGDMTNTVGGKLTTTVAGQATENFNGGLDTTVTGTEKHTVNGKQINTVTEGQENIISGGQTNTITGGQINNITGDQTTTITGNKKETVTENVTEDYKKDLTTTVGGNETHEVKGTKTETVEGKLTENFKGGQETNVTGDQTTNVSGTQTTTATDIKRNASSGMIDTIDNDYGTNTETKVAGKTTTDVSIKGTEEKGQYIRGANESRDYLIKGTLKNSETKTAEATSTEITDGTNKASTRQDAKNLAGSVTNGTETGISGIHANDDGSVSIDSAVAGGGMSSVINQKKDSIQSAVGDGTNSTVIHQDKDNVTIASSNGTVGIVGKDIVNNAQNTITNTAGTSITNQVNDSKVTTDANGTTFENNTPAVSDGGATTTKINGNQITTGRVNANELGVSDKDGANTADFSVEAGEGKGVNASAGNGTTTGSLDVTAEEVSSSVKDASGKGSTFKQRIDKIMMESKDVSIKAEETLTNEAKVITNKASEVINNEAVNINNTATGIITSKASEIKNQADKLISNKVGENTWENMENGKITTSIKDGAKQNLTQSDAAGTTQSTVDGGKSTVTIQNADGLVGVVTDGRTTSVQNQTASQIEAAVKDGAGNENASVANATTSANTIKSGSKANTVISTADGTSFINSEAAAPVGDGTAVNTTIKGNTITTGKVTMDYAEVMKDLGVHGNAKVDQNLEVGGTSTLKGDVTMESNATVKKDLKVEGTTTTKTLKVTENAEIDGTLKVTKKATFEDSVSIAKDLSVGGDVTAKSYKVGDKTYIDANGIHANDQKITNVADGSISEGSKDAVNGGQLYGVKRDLEHQVDKVGANAAAMANLRPMEFDPSSKWNIAAAIGNYGSETAAALGAFYRPNDDVMVNLSTAFGTGENMVGGGVSVRLGKSSNKLSREENNALKAQVDDLTARMDALLSVLNPNMSKDFPDVPENHWAYEAVSRLAGNDIVQGYPDGEFHGERTMTRYEMAEIIYNALSRGAEAEKELVEEFKPELQAMASSEKATAEKAEG